MGPQGEPLLPQGLYAAPHVHDQLQQGALCAVADPGDLTCTLHGLRPARHGAKTIRALLLS